MSPKHWLKQLLGPRHGGWAGQRRRRQALQGRIARLHLEGVEDRVLLDGGGLRFDAIDARPLTLRLHGGELQVIGEESPTQVLAARSLAEITEGALINGAGFDVQLTIDASVPRVPGGVRFVGGDGFSSLVGPAADSVWHVTGDGEGRIGDPGFVSFVGVETLQGAAGNQDTFRIEQAGAIRGRIDGGTGGYDTIVLTGAYQRVSYAVTGPQSGDIGLDGTFVHYFGMEPIEFTAPVEDFEYSGTSLDDDIVLRDIDGDDGRMEIAGSTEGVPFETVRFPNPTGSLTISALSGDDAIVVESLDADFSARLLVYGDEGGAPDRTSDDRDSVSFTGSISTNNGYLEAFAQTITVADGVLISTGESDIVFRAREIATADLDNLNPLVFVDLKSVSISIGENATIAGASIYFVAQAQDRTLTEALGMNQLYNNFLINPLRDRVAGLTALPVQVLAKESSAAITLSQGARVIGSGTVGMYATAAADATGRASSRLFSIGYSHAVSTATIDFQQDALVIAGNALVITSTASSTAKMTTETSTDSNPGASSVAVSLAVTYADVTSLVTVAEGARLVAGKTANLSSLANLSSEAKASSARQPGGDAGLAFAIELSDADVHTTVNGEVTAPLGDSSAVKLEIDPTETDPSRPGYVDYDRNMINIGGMGLVTEDTVTYFNRRGSSIGRADGNGLINGNSYFVVNPPDDPATGIDESQQFIQLARTEQQAIEGEVIDLDFDPNLPASTIRKDFSGVDVDGAADTIVLDNPAASGGGVNFSLFGQTFELGQPVVYREGSAPIAGLEDGRTYYVITSIDQFNLQGNSRFVDQQVIQLAETEYEARAGVAINIGGAASGATGYRLDAKHVLDSGFSPGVGVIALLNVVDKTSASAGLSLNATQTGLPGVLTRSVFDTIFGAFARNFTDNAGKAGSGASRSLQVGGALAVSVGTHSVLADVGGTADLQSNGDLEVKATINQRTQMSAESSTEPALNGAPRNTASLALGVSVLDNTAVATIHSGADLDALRAVRVISLIQYPLLIAPDQYFPATLGEFIGSVQNEGFDSVNKYLSGTLGFRDGLLNSWAGSTAKSDNISIAGAVNLTIQKDRAESIVQSGVDINQDSAWRDNVLNPHPNQAASQPDGLSEQTVSIEASTFKQLVNMAGFFVFDLPALNIDPLNPSVDRRFSFNPVASSGREGGVGGVILMQLLDHTTRAIVENGARIRSGEDGGFNMKADELIFNINLGQSGASSNKFAVGGTVLYAQQTSDTLARLGETAEVTGRDLDIYAASLGVTATWAGGVSLGGNVGIGIGVSVNNIDRRTRAVIGDPDAIEAEPGPIRGSTSIDVTEDVRLRSVVDGQLWSFAAAGAAATGQAPDMPASGETVPGSPTQQVDPLGSSATPAQFDQQAAPEMSRPMTGIGAAGAVSINVVKDRTQASIADAGQVRAGGDLALIAENNLFHVAATGGAAFAVPRGMQNPSAIAGAFSFNNLDTATRAFILDSSVTAYDVGVSAERTGQLIAISAGAAGNTGNQGIAVAGSISVNRLTNATEAYAEASRITASGAGGIAASDESGIASIGGGAGIGGATGVGFSIGVNQIDSDVRASVADSAVSFVGPLNVEATNDNALRSLGISAGAGKDNGVAFTIGANLIGNRTTAEIVDNSSAVGSSVAVLARDDSNLQALSGAAALGINGSGFGGALAWNSVTGQVVARVESSDIATAGDAVIRADVTESDLLLDGKILAGAVGAVGSSRASIGGAVGVNVIRHTADAHVSDGSSIQAGGLATVKADDSSSIQSLTGGAVISIGAAGVGAAISNNDILNRVAALAEDSEIVAAGLTVSAVEDADVRSITLGLAGAEHFAAGGSVSVNVVQNDTEARIAGAATNVQVTGDVSVSAIDKSEIQAIAGAIGAAKSAAVGAAIAANSIGTAFNGGHQTRAAISGGLIHAEGSVAVAADSEQDIESYAVAGAGAQGFALGGAVTAATTRLATEASIGGSAVAIADDVIISARSDAAIRSAAGALAVALFSETVSVAITASNSTVVTDDSVRAALEDQAQAIASRDVIVTATSTEDILSLAAGAAFAAGGSPDTAFASFALAGSATVAVLRESTIAEILPGTNASAGRDVQVFAHDDTKWIGAAGGLGAAVWAGGGAGVDVATVLKTTAARLGGEVSAGDDVLVQAESDEDGLSVTAAGGVGGVAVSGAAGVIILGTDADPLTTEATILPGAIVETGDSVLVAADDDAETDIVAGSIQAGLATLGGAVGVVASSKIVDASIQPGAVVTAQGNGDGVLAATGDIVVSYVANAPSRTGMSNEVAAPPVNNNDADDESLTRQRAASLVSQTRRGVAVTATHRDDSETYALTAGLSAPIPLSGGPSLSLSGAVNIAETAVSARIDGATVAAENGSDVRLAAASDRYQFGVGGAGAIGGGSAAASPGLAISIGKQTTVAEIVGGALVSASGDVEIQANANDDALLITASLTVSGGPSIAGAVSTIDIDNETRASVESGSTVRADGDATIEATDRTEADLLAGGLGIGGGGFGGSAGLIFIEKATTAETNGTISPYRNAVMGDVAIRAESSEDLFSIAVSGAAGLLAASGAVSAQIVDSDTAALLGGDIAEAGSVAVIAANELDMRTIDGTISGSLVGGIGGAVDIGIVRNDTTAAIGDGAAIDARSGVTVAADSAKAIDSLVASASGSLGVGAAGAVAVYSIGGIVDDGYEVGGASAHPLNQGGVSTVAHIDSASDNRNATNVLGSYGSDPNDPYRDDALPEHAPNSNDRGLDGLASARNSADGARRTSRTASAMSSSDSSSGTTARVGAGALVTVGSGGISATATEDLDLDIIAGGAAAGLGLGVGAGVAIVNIGSDTQAIVGDGAQLQAGGPVLIEAAGTQDIDVLSIAGAGGIVALGASVVVIDDDHLTTARIHGATIESGSSVVVRADNDSDAHASAVSASVGGIAAGASVVDIDADGRTEASIDGAARITASGLALQSSSNAAIGGLPDLPATPANESLMVAGIGGGLLTGVGGSASATIGGSTQAVIGGSAIVNVSGGVVVSAMSEDDARASAVGAAAGLAAVGVMLADASIRGDTTATVNGAAITASSVSVSATAAGSASAEAVPASAGAIAGAGADSDARADRDALATAGGVINAGSGFIRIRANSDNEARAASGAVSAGLVGLGFANADADVSGLTQAQALAGSNFTAGDIEVLANGDHFADATVFSARGGLATGGSTRAEATAFPIVASHVGGSAVLNAADDILIDADSSTRSKSTAHGVSRSGINVATSRAISTSSPQIAATVGADATLDAGDRIDINAGLNREANGSGIANAAWAQAFSSNGSLLVGIDLGTEAIVTANPTVTVSVGAGADVLADNAVAIRSDIYNQTRAHADGDNTGLVTTGATNAESMTNAQAVADIGAGARVGAASSVSIEAAAESRPIVRAEGGTGRSFSEQFATLASGDISRFLQELSLPSLYANGGARASASDSTSAATVINAGAEVGAVEPNRDLIPEALTLSARTIVVVDSDSAQESDGLTAVSAVAVSDVVVDADSDVRIRDGAAVHGNHVDLIARNRADINSYANSITDADAGGSFSTAVSRANLGSAFDPSLATIRIAPGAVVTGDSSIDLEATGGQLFAAINSAAEARATTLVLATATASAEGSVFARSDIAADADSTLITRNLEIDSLTNYALNRVPTASAEGFITRIERRVREVVRSVTRHIPLIGSLIEQVVEEIIEFVTIFEFSDTNTNTAGVNDSADDVVALNGRILLGSAQDRSLTVNADGSIAGNIGAAVTATQVVVDDVINNAAGQAVVRATRGQIIGSAIITLPKILGRVDIANHSNRDLIINRIDAISPNNGEPDTIFLDSDGTAGANFTYTAGAEFTIIDIRDTGASDIIFDDSILNAIAALTVINAGGGIRTDDPAVRLEFGDVGSGAPAVKLDAAGDIGSSASPIRVNLVRRTAGSSIAVLDADTLGRLHLDITGLQLQTIAVPPPSLVNGFRLDLNSVEDWDVRLRDGAVSVASPQFVPDGSSSVAALNATPRDVSYSINGGSAVGDANLVATGSPARDIDVAIISWNAPQGAARIQTTGAIVSEGPSGISADSAELVAEDGVGAAGQPLPTQVRRLEGAALAGGLFLSNAGDLIIGGSGGLTGLRAIGGDIAVTASGPIDVQENVLATGTIALTSVDATIGAQDIRVRDGSMIVADGPIALNAGDSLRMDPAGVIQTGSTLLIEAGQSAIDTGGGVVMIQGSLSAASSTIATGGDGDRIVIQSVSVNGPLTVLAGAGDDLIEATSASGLDLTIDGQAGVDEYMIFLTGTSAAAPSSILVSDSDTSGASHSVTIRGTANNDAIRTTAHETVLGTEAVRLSESGDYELTIDGQGGDDAIVIAQSLIRATNARGGSGRDEVRLDLRSIDPTQSANANFVALRLDTEILTVDNSAFAGDVSWTVRSEMIRAGSNLVVQTAGAGEIQVLGGSGRNALTVASDVNSNIDGTIDGDRVTLIEGRNVLAFESRNNALSAGAIDGLAGASDIAAALDGQTILVAGRTDNAIAVFRRTSPSSVELAQTIRLDVDGAVTDRWSNAIASSFPDHWYRFNDSGVTASDSGFNSSKLNGTYNGAVADGGSNSGAVDGAARFDTYGAHVQLNGAPIHTAWTAEFLLLNTEANLAGISRDLLGDSATALKLNQHPGTSELGFTRFNVADYRFTPPVPTPSLQYAHIVFTGAPGSGVQIYVNGVLAGSNSTFIALPMQRIGHPGNDTVRGLIDEAAVYRRALSAAEIASHAQSLIGDPGLAAPDAIIISPDQQNAYAATRSAIQILEAGADGRWTHVGSVNEAAVSRLHLSGPIRLAISPNGLQVYATVPGQSSLLVFNRAADGGLTLAQTIGPLTELSRAAAIEATADGSRVMVGFDGGVAIFKREVDGLLDQASGLSHFEGIAVDRQELIWISPNGDFAYAVGTDATDNNIRVHRRDNASGAILETIQSIPFTNAIDIGANSSGTVLYAARADSIRVYSRNPTTGRLTERQAVAGVNIQAISLTATQAYALSAGASFSDTLTIYNLNADGSLGTSTTRIIGANTRDVIASPTSADYYLRTPFGFERYNSGGVLLNTIAPPSFSPTVMTVSVSDGRDFIFISSATEHRLYERTGSASSGLVQLNVGSRPASRAPSFAVAQSGRVYLSLANNTIEIVDIADRLIILVPGGTLSPSSSFIGATGRLAVSPDGNSLYATSTATADIIHRYRQNLTGWTFQTPVIDQAATPFNDLTDLTTAGNFTYAVTANGVLETINHATGLIQQSLSLPILNGAQSVTASPDGRFVTVVTSADQIVTFSRPNNNGNNGSLTETPTQIASGPAGSRAAIVASNGTAGAALFAIGSTLGQLNVHERDPLTGLIGPAVQQIQDGTPLALHRIADLVATAAGFAYGASPDDDAVVVLDVRSASGSVAQTQALRDGLGGAIGIRGAAALAVDPSERHLYVAASDDNGVALYDISAADGSLTNPRTIRNVAGLTAPQSIVVTTDGRHVYVGGASGLAGFQRAADGTLTPLAPALAADDIIDVRLSPDGARLFAVSRSDGNLRIFSRDAIDGSLTPLASATGLNGASAALIVSDGSGGQFAYIAAADDHAAVVLRIDNAGAVTTIETVRDGEAGVRGIRGASDLTSVGGFVLVSGSESDAVAVFQRDPVSGRLAFVQTVRNNVGGIEGLNAPTALTAGPNNMILAGTADGDVARFIADLMRPPPIATLVSHGGISDLTVATSAGDDNVRILNAAPSPTLTTTIDTGAGFDQVTANDLAGSTFIQLGDGDDDFESRSAAPGTALTVQGGAGRDQFLISRVGASTVTTLSGGDDEDSFRVDGFHIPVSATVTIHGDDPATLPGDTLLFNPGEVNGVPRGVQTFEPNGTTPTLGFRIPAGQVQAVGGFGRVVYDTIEAAQAQTLPVADAGGPYVISEGQSLALLASAETFGAAIESASWDLDGDGDFSDAFGLAPILSPAALAALGLGDGTASYPIAVRVTTVNGSGDAFATLTVTNVAPTLTVTVTGPPTIGIGQPFVVRFSATDPGDDRIVEWRIDWGDGRSSIVGSESDEATHVYLTPGNVQVAVSAIDEDGETFAAPLSVLATNADPQIRRIELSGPILEGSPFTIAVIADDDGGASGLTYAFDFSQPNDGVFEVQNANGIASHVFADNGSYSVMVRVSDAFGGSAVQTLVIDVENVAPTIHSASAAGVLAEGSAVTFTVVASDPAGANDALTYDFDFDNDGIYDVSDSDGIASHTFADNGSLLVGVRVRDGDGDGGETTEVIRVDIANVAPIVSISGPSTVNEGAVYTLSLDPAIDPGADAIIGWRIYWGDGSISEIAGRPTSVDHIFADNGAFDITAVAIDEDGEYAADNGEPLRVTVANIAPTAVIAGASSAAEGLYTLSLAVADPGADTVSERIIDWGDGSIESYPGDAASAVHLYDGGNPSSSYTITAQVVDEDGIFSSNSLTVVIANTAPTIQSVQTLTAGPREAGPVAIAVSATDPLGDADPLVYEFDFDNDGIFEIANPTGQAVHTFADDGAFPVTVRVTDDDGGETVETITIVVANVEPTATIIGSATVIAEGSPYQLAVSFSDPGADSAVSYVIDWGDGTIETFPAANLAPTHVYDGPILVRPALIRIIDEDGSFAALAAADPLQVLGVDPTLPAALSATRLQISEPLTLTFGSLTDPGADSVFRHEIAWGDGSVESFSGAPTAGQSLTHLFTRVGDLTLRVTLHDEDGTYDVVVIAVNVFENSAPTADAGGPYAVNEGSAIVLSAAGTSDPDQNPNTLIYEWDLDGDGVFGEVGADAVRGDEVGVQPTFSALTLDGPTSVTVGLRVTDQGGLTDETTAVIHVANVAPTLILNPVAAINENGIATLTGSIIDPGRNDAFTLTVNWGDPLSPNNTETYLFPAGTRDFTLTHRYLDDNGAAGSPFDIDSIAATADDGGPVPATAATTVRVNNVAPTFASLTSSRNSLQARGASRLVSLNGAFSDVGSLDSHTALVNWGDGSPIQAVPVNQALRTLAGTHTYASGGMYTITATIADDDGGTAILTTTAVATGVGVVDGTLYIIGTDGRDHVKLKVDERKNELDIDVKLNQGGGSGSELRFRQTLTASAIHRVVTFLHGGDDHYDGGGSQGRHPAGDEPINIRQQVYGGAGDDHLSGGYWDDAIFGDSGNDDIRGESGDDILVGGDGKDKIKGGRGRDVLIGGIVSNNFADPLIVGEVDEAMRRWAVNDLAEMLLLLGPILEDDDNDDLFGEEGEDELFGGVGDKLKP